MWERIKKLFSSDLKRTAERNSGMPKTKKTDKLPKETINQSGFADSESAEDFEDLGDDKDDNTPYHDTSDYCMIRPDASVTADDDTTNCQSS